MQVRQSRWALPLVAASIGIASCGESLEEQVTSAAEREQRQLEQKKPTAQGGQRVGAETPAPSQVPAGKTRSRSSSPQREGKSTPSSSQAPIARVGDAKVQVDRFEGSSTDKGE
jgi:hypothetical protein